MSAAHKQLDHRDFGGAVVATALFVTAMAPLMIAAVGRAPGVAALAHAGAICCSAELMRRLRGSEHAKLGRAAWVVSWLHCAIVIAGALTDVPAWVGTVARLAAVASMVAVCLALAGEARVARGRDAARAWMAAAFAAGAGWLVFLLVQGIWNDSMEAAVRKVGGLVLLASAAGLFGPAVMVYRAASESRLPLQFRGWCTFCGYDMRTLSTRTCPECGKTSYLRKGEVAEPITKRRGQWKAVLLHSIAGVLGGMAVGGVLPNNELHRYKPLWLLVRECKLGPQAFSRSSVDQGRGGFPPMWEVLRRADLGEFDRATASELADRCLKIQADESEPLYMWLELFAILDAQGVVSDAQRRAFVEHLSINTLKLPSSVPEGSHLPFTLVNSSRAPMSYGGYQSQTSRWDESNPKLVAVWVDGVKVPAPERVADAIGQGFVKDMDFTPAGPLPRMPSGAGSHRVKMEFAIDCRVGPARGGPATSRSTRAVALEGAIVFTAGPSTPVTLVTDSAAIEPLLKRWTWTYESYRLGGYKGRNGVAITAPEGEPALAFDVTANVVIAYKGKEYPMGRLVIKAGDRSAFVHDNMSWEPDFPGDVLPLIIRATNIDLEAGLQSAWSGPEQRVDAKFRDPPPKR